MPVGRGTRALLLVAACDGLSVRPALRVPATPCHPRHAVLVMNAPANAAAIQAVLASQPGWDAGQAVTVNTVWERVVGSGSLTDDEFDDALDLLEAGQRVGRADHHVVEETCRRQCATSAGRCR